MAHDHEPSVQGKGRGPVCRVTSVNAVFALPAALSGGDWWVQYAHWWVLNVCQ